MMKNDFGEKPIFSKASKAFEENTGNALSKRIGNNYSELPDDKLKYRFISMVSARFFLDAKGDDAKKFQAEQEMWHQATDLGASLDSRVISGDGTSSGREFWSAFSGIKDEPQVEKQSMLGYAALSVTSYIGSWFRSS